MRSVNTILLYSLLVIFLMSGVAISNIEAQSGNIGIGTTTPESSALLDLSSDSHGLLIPRMTIAERNAIENPAIGLMVFITQDSSFYYYSGIQWEKVGKKSELLIDQDKDTKIQLEEIFIDDVIRIFLEGTEHFVLKDGRINVMNTGNSVFIGNDAGLNDNLTDNRNTAVGTSSLRANITGSNNSAFGIAALRGNSSGNKNTAVGDSSLTSNLQGNYNTAVGSNTLHKIVGAHRNTAVGTEAMYSLTSTGRNTAMGYRALYSLVAGNENTAIGTEALYSSVQTGANTAIGCRALFNNWIGSSNSAVGYAALNSNILGSKNTAIGTRAGFSSIGVNNVFIGYEAGYADTSDYRLYIESSAADSTAALIYGEFDNDLLTFNADVGIGTTVPQEKLHISGGNILADRGSETSAIMRSLVIGGARNASSSPYAAINFQNFDSNDSAADYFGAAIASYNITGSESGDLRFFTSNNSTLQFAMAIVDGNVGIGTIAPTAKLTVNGDANKPGGGTWQVFSDARLKDTGDAFSRGLAEVMQLQPVSYNYKSGNPYDFPSDVMHYGFIAQEVQKVVPEAVDDSGEYLTLQADPIYLAMLNAIKEQQVMIEELKKENTELKGNVHGVMAELAEIRQLLLHQAEEHIGED